MSATGGRGGKHRVVGAKTELTAPLQMYGGGVVAHSRDLGTQKTVVH